MSTPDRVGEGRGMTGLERWSLTALALVAWLLAFAFPARPGDAVSWPERDAVVCFQAQQLFQRDPEELSESELNDLKRWCRCMQLVVRHQNLGVRSLNDEERQLVASTLDEFCADLDEYAGYRRIRDSCRRSLNDGAPTTVGSNDELHSQVRRVVLK